MVCYQANEQERRERGLQTELPSPSVGTIKKPPVWRFFMEKCFGIYASCCEIFNRRPVLGISNSKIHVYGVRFGRLENVWRKCIRYHLRNIKHIDDNIIFVTHAGLSVRQQELILDEIHRCVKFKHIIFTQASVANVCNAGLNSIGFAVYRK